MLKLGFNPVFCISINEVILLKTALFRIIQSPLVAMKWLLLFVVCGVVMPIYALELAQIDQLTRQWLDIEKQNSQLQKDWRIQEPLLAQRLALLNAEKKQLTSLINIDGQKNENVDGKRKALLEQQTRFEQQQIELEHQLALLTNQLLFIKQLLPPPLIRSWQKEQQVLGVDPDLSLQLQVALAKLSTLAEFEQRISLYETPLTSPRGKEVLVKQLYLGTGIAWFTSANGEFCGWGQANENGWTWHFDNQVDATEVKRAIAIFEKKQQADFTELPIKLVINSSSDSKWVDLQKNEGKS